MVRHRLVINPIEKPADNYGDSTVFSHVKTFATRLVQRKTIKQLQVEAEGGNELKRTLTTLQSLALGVGGIIGKFNEQYLIEWISILSS
jgi:hypothetical protein